jgi:hypothetical protein
MSCLSSGLDWFPCKYFEGKKEHPPTENRVFKGLVVFMINAIYMLNIVQCYVKKIMPATAVG